MKESESNVIKIIELLAIPNKDACVAYFKRLVAYKRSGRFSDKVRARLRNHLENKLKKNNQKLGEITIRDYFFPNLIKRGFSDPVFSCFVCYLNYHFEGRGKSVDENVELYLEQFKSQDISNISNKFTRSQFKNLWDFIQNKRGYKDYTFYTFCFVLGIDGQTLEDLSRQEEQESNEQVVIQKKKQPRKKALNKLIYFGLAVVTPLVIVIMFYFHVYRSKLESEDDFQLSNYKTYYNKMILTENNDSIPYGNCRHFWTMNNNADAPMKIHAIYLNVLENSNIKMKDVQSVGQKLTMVSDELSFELSEFNQSQKQYIFTDQPIGEVGAKGFVPLWVNVKGGKGHAGMQHVLFVIEIDYSYLGNGHSGEVVNNKLVSDTLEICY